METIQIFLTYFLISESYSAVVKTDQKLQTIKEDLVQIGTTINDLAFESFGIVEDFLTEPAEITEIAPKERKKRSTTDEDIKELCKKHFEDNICSPNSSHIKDLQTEMKKLQELVALLGDQQTMIDSLKAEDFEGKAREEALALIKLDLQEAVKNLNQTREMLGLERKQSGVLEGELRKQKTDLEKLQQAVAKISQRNANITNSSTPTDNLNTSRTRESEFSELKKFLGNSDDGVDDSSEIQAKVLDLEKRLKKKKRQQNLARELKILEEKMERVDDGSLMKKLEKALRPQTKSDDDVSSLTDLQEAIDKLRPKQESLQFQSALGQLIANQPSRPLEFTNPKPQEVTKPNRNAPVPYLCFVDGSVPQRVPNYYQAPPSNPPRDVNFFPAPPSNQPHLFQPPAAQPGYYAGADVDTVSSQKSGAFAEDGSTKDKEYYASLKEQIEGLQEAIDSLNRPEYTQDPNNKAALVALRQQIADLRSIVQNLNQRAKRSIDDGTVDENLDKMAELVGKILDKADEEKRTRDLRLMQNRIDQLKQELSNNGTQRSAGSYYPQVYQRPGKEIKTVKDDFFTELISKLFDRVLAVIPILVKKLFNFGIDELTNYDYQNDYGVQEIFKNLGIFGFIPAITLRLIYGFGYFIDLLRKNRFFRNFLVPVGVLGIVAGSVMFLIWWLQPDAFNQYQIGYGYGSSATSGVTYQSSYGGTDPTTPANTYDTSQSSSYPVYSKSYYN